MICLADETAFGPKSTASFINPSRTSSSVGSEPGNEAYRWERSRRSHVDAHADIDAAALTDTTTSSHTSRCIINATTPAAPVAVPARRTARYRSVLGTQFPLELPLPTSSGPELSMPERAELTVHRSTQSPANVR